jgi:SOS-response transcriptional repressor LexA
MSNAALKYVRTMDGRLSSAERALLWPIADAAHNQTWESHFNRKTLAKLTGLSEATVKRALRCLEERGLIRRTPRMKGRLQLSNIVAIIKPECADSDENINAQNMTPGFTTSPPRVHHEPPRGSPCAPYIEPSLEPSEEASAEAAPRVDVEAVYARVIEAANGSLNPLSRHMAVNDVLGWMNAGADLDLDIIPAVKRVAHRKTPGSIKTLGYFAGAVAEERDRRLKGLPDIAATVPSANPRAHMRRY